MITVIKELTGFLKLNRLFCVAELRCNRSHVIGIKTKSRCRLSSAALAQNLQDHPKGLRNCSAESYGLKILGCDVSLKTS